MFAPAIVAVGADKTATATAPLADCVQPVTATSTNSYAVVAVNAGVA